MTANLDSLLFALAGCPSLPGARCRGKGHLFDPAAIGEQANTVAARHAQAIALCRGCPALTRCTDWLNSLEPKHKPDGVIAGQLRSNPVGRPKDTKSRNGRVSELAGPLDDRDGWRGDANAS